VSRTAKAAVGMSEGQFLATVAHELKAPLHTIETISHSAADGTWGNPPKALHVQLNRIELSARRMLELADSLLRLEQVRSGRLKPLLSSIRPYELVQEVLETLQPFLDEREQTLEHIRRRTVLPALADPLYARHALLNILLNAARYSPPGSQLSLWISQRKGAVCIDVRDEAPLLGQHARRQVANPRPLPGYTRDKNGYGMGLFIATRFIESCGGTLEYHQMRGKGNRFVLCLPIARQLTLFGEEDAL
jgi:two-component system sensor histidine kinase VicK